MKTILSITMTLTLGVIFFLSSGCEQDKCVRTEQYLAYEPVYKRIDEMRMPMNYGTPKGLTSPGKIFYYNGYLFVNEMNSGIHVIDNRNPENPINVGFMDIPGNLDMAVHGDVLYVDSYLDLVAINITNPEAPVEVDRTNDIFQSFYSYNDQLGYLVEYKPTNVLRTIDCNNSNWSRWGFFEGDVFLSSDATFGGELNAKASGNVSASVVVGGSMARFTAINDYLYTIDGQKIKVFDVNNVHPVFKNDVYSNWGIETLFPMAGSLFVGSNAGLLIYSIADPENPQYKSTFDHAQACDPVVVSDDIAFVTLRDGSTCNGFTNQLDVIDVSDIENPRSIRSFPMQNPHGLSVVDKTLYLCEGEFGFKTFDISNLEKIGDNLEDHLQGFNAYDVIVLPQGEHVMVIGEDGLYQFDATDKANLVQLSVIGIER